MQTAFIIIVIILGSAGSRLYFKRKYDVTQERDKIKKAFSRNNQARVRHEAAQH